MQREQVASAASSAAAAAVGVGLQSLDIGIEVLPPIVLPRLVVRGECCVLASRRSRGP